MSDSFEEQGAVQQKGLTEENPYAAPSPIDDWNPDPLEFVGNVLTQGARLCANQWIAIGAVVAIVWGPIGFALSYLEYEGSVDFEGVVLVASMLLEFVTYSLGTAAVIAIAMGAASGRPVTIAEALATAARVSVRFAVTYFFTSLMILIGFLFLILPGLYLMVVLSLVDSVVVAEGKWGARAIGRSYDLASMRFWPRGT